MEKNKNKGLKYYRKLSVECVVFSILGMIVLVLTNYSNGNFFMTELLFWSMLSAAALILFIGVIGFTVTSIRIKKDR